MDATRQKFQTAAHFFGKLQATQNPIEFVFTLSAFLAEARATTWVLTDEYAGSEFATEFRDWYGDPGAEEYEEGTVRWQMANSHLFQFMNSLRRPATGSELDTGTALSVESLEFDVSQGDTEGQFQLEPPSKIEEAASTRIQMHFDGEPGGLQQSIYPGNGDVEVEGEYYFGEVPDPFDSIPVGALANRYFDGLYEILYDWEKFVFGETDLEDIQKEYQLDPRDIFVESRDDPTME